MKETKNLHTRQIDKRVFDQDIRFLHTTNLTPTLKTEVSLEQINKIPIKNPLLTSTQDEAQLKEIYSQLLKKIQFLENNFQWVLENLKQITKDHNKQYNDLLKKIQIIKRKDEQVEMLMERQDQMVQTFQQKINQLQEIIKQQEIKLINAQLALNKAHQHLDRIKNSC